MCKIARLLAGKTRSQKIFFFCFISGTIIDIKPMNINTQNLNYFTDHGSARKTTFILM